MATDPDGPPFFRSWNGAYLLVLGWLAVLVGLFTLLTRAYP
jgi:hypothetical protein